MFYNLTTHPDLTQEQHRALPHVSNTDLSNLKQELLGQPRQPNPVALAYGSHFHTAVLEPATYARTWRANCSRSAHLMPRSSVRT